MKSDLLSFPQLKDWLGQVKNQIGKLFEIKPGKN